MHRYRNLRVWSHSVDLARHVYRIADAAPKREQFAAAGQMRRAALSIPSSIAEGSSRRTATEFRRFIDIAMGSAYELDTQLEVLSGSDWLPSSTAIELQTSLSDIRSMLYGLKRSAVDQTQ